MLWLPDQVLGAYGSVLCATAETTSWADDWECALRSIDVLRVDL